MKLAIANQPAARIARLAVDRARDARVRAQPDLARVALGVAAAYRLMAQEPARLPQPVRQG